MCGFEKNGASDKWALKTSRQIEILMPKAERWSVSWVLSMVVSRSSRSPADCRRRALIGPDALFFFVFEPKKRKTVVFFVKRRWEIEYKIVEERPAGEDGKYITELVVAVVCWLVAISGFPTMLSRGSFFGGAGQSCKRPFPGAFPRAFSRNSQGKKKTQSSQKWLNRHVCYSAVTFFD